MPVVNNANDVSSVSARVFAILKDFDVWHMPLFSLLSQIINQSLLKKTGDLSAMFYLASFYFFFPFLRLELARFVRMELPRSRRKIQNRRGKKINMDIDGENERNRELFRVPLRPAVQVFITRRWHLGEATVNHLGVSLNTKRPIISRTENPLTPRSAKQDG